MNNQVLIFAGPSLFGAGIEPNDTAAIRWAPPARRGDIERLLAQEGSDTPRVIGLADGTFHSYPAIGHAEIRAALVRGYKVFGLCSMGAIRACEMRHLGMTPWGSVAKKFCDEPDLADDEVALVHGTDFPFTPLSEPLLHIREFLSRMKQDKILTASQTTEVLESMRTRWYGERTLRKLREVLTSTLGGVQLSAPLVAALTDFTPFRLKQKDMRHFVQQQPWHAA